MKFKFTIHFKYRFDVPVKNGVNKILCDAYWTLSLSLLLHIVKSNSVFVEFHLYVNGLCEMVFSVSFCFVSWDSYGNSNGENEPNRILYDQN